MLLLVSNTMHAFLTIRQAWSTFRLFILVTQQGLAKYKIAGLKTGGYLRDKAGYAGLIIQDV